MTEKPVTKMEVFFDAWSSTLAALLSQLSSRTWAFAGMTSADSYTPAAVLRISLQQGMKGSLCTSLSAEDAALLLEVFTGEKAAIAGMPDAAQSEALCELVRQWAGLAASRLKPVFGDVGMEVALEAETALGLAGARLLRIASEERAVAVRIEMDSDLLGQLDRRQTPRAPLVPEARAGSLDQLLREGNLDLLLDVELGVTLRFGSRRAPLREVLELSPGAVLELNREIQEPVDLLLNDRVIARGDVVVVDGNYGLHITEVISPEQRLSHV